MEETDSEAQTIVARAVRGVAVVVDGLGQARIVRWGGSDVDEARRVLAAAVRDQLVRRTARAGWIGYLAYFIFGPAFLWLAAGAVPYAIAVFALVGASIVALWLQAYRGVRSRPAFVVGFNVALVALVAHATSPFLLAPGIAAVTTMSIGMSPTYERPRNAALLTIAMIAGALGPWLAEQLGWIATTTTATREGFVIDAIALHLRVGGQHVLLVLYTVFLIAAAGVQAFNLSRAQRGS